MIYGSHVSGPMLVGNGAAHITTPRRIEIAEMLIVGQASRNGLTNGSGQSTFFAQSQLNAPPAIASPNLKLEPSISGSSFSDVSKILNFGREFDRVWRAVKPNLNWRFEF